MAVHIWIKSSASTMSRHQCYKVKWYFIRKCLHLDLKLAVNNPKIGMVTTTKLKMHTHDHSTTKDLGWRYVVVWTHKQDKVIIIFLDQCSPFFGIFLGKVASNIMIMIWLWSHSSLDVFCKLLRDFFVQRQSHYIDFVVILFCGFSH